MLWGPVPVCVERPELSEVFLLPVGLVLLSGVLSSLHPAHVETARCATYR